MTWHHRIQRAHWQRIRVRHYPEYARQLGPNPDIAEQLKLAVALLWRLARQVFLLHCVDKLAYDEIATRVGADIATVKRCMGDALISMCMICDQFE